MKKKRKKKGIDAVLMSKFPDNSSELQWKSRKKKEAKKNKKTNT